MKPMSRAELLKMYGRFLEQSFYCTFKHPKFYARFSASQHLGAAEVLGWSPLRVPRAHGA